MLHRRNHFTRDHRILINDVTDMQAHAFQSDQLIPMMSRLPLVLKLFIRPLI